MGHVSHVFPQLIYNLPSHDSHLYSRRLQHSTTLRINARRTRHMLLYS